MLPIPFIQWLGITLGFHHLSRSRKGLQVQEIPQFGTTSSGLVVPFQPWKINTLSVRGSSPGSLEIPRGMSQSWRSPLPSPADSPKSLWQRKGSAWKGLAVPAMPPLLSMEIFANRSCVRAPSPAELLECCCPIPIPSRESGGAGSCSPLFCFAARCKPRPALILGILALWGHQELACRLSALFPGWILAKC